MKTALALGPDRPVRWDEFRQRIRAHRPSELLPAIAAAGAEQFDGGPLKINPAGLQPWGLAEIARESLAGGNEHRAAPVKPDTLRRLHGLYSRLDDPYAHEGGGGPWDYMVRTVYEQASWQGAVYSELARFGALLDRDFGGGYEVLSREALSELFGADPGVYFRASMLFVVGAQRNAGWFGLGWLEQPQFAEVAERIPADVLRDIFGRSFGAPYALVAQRARTGRNPDPRLRRYDLNPLAATPYVQMRPGVYLAPVPRLVAERASLNAVYYLGQNKWGAPFTRDLGRLVEAYAGEQLALVLGGTLTGERLYGKGGASKTIDWLLVLPGVVVLVEVKSARVAAPGRLDLTSWAEDVRRDVGKSMRQIATTAKLLREKHPVLADVPVDRPVRGIIVTAEPHYLINSPIYRSELSDPAVPTVVMSLAALEGAVAFALLRDPSEVFLALTDWHQDQGVHPERVLHGGWRENSERNPPNPILDAAWKRHSWLSLAVDS